MTEYIEREATIYEIEHDAPGQVRYSREDAVDCVRYMLAADVEPVRHGRWIQVGSPWNGYVQKCSHCLETVKSLSGQLRFCPNCGAKMDAKESTEDD